MELWAMGAILMLTIGVALIGIGWHGRRIDRHPLCAACGYDLIGRLPFARRCAECGADISGLAIRVGHRAFRPRPFYGGLALSLPALLMITSITYVVMRGIDITSHKPAWWLVYELGGSREGDQFGDVVATRKLEVKSPFDVRAPSIQSPQITAAMPPAR